MLKILQDILQGIAIGDAFGAGLEFQDRNWIKENVDFTSFVNRRKFINHPDIELFVKDYIDWQYTDDTEMTVGLIKTLLSGKDFTEDFLVECIKQEYQLGFETKGFYRNGHGALRWYFNGEKTLEEIRSFQKTRKNPGNAPVVRVVPLGFLDKNEIEKFATINALSTHPNNRAIEASVLIARATRAIIIEKIELSEVIHHCCQYISDAEFLEILQKADILPEPINLNEDDYKILCGFQPLKDFIPGLNGLPSCAMHTAISILYVLKHSKSTFEGLKNSVNIGGDVDSLASVVVGILAGRFGLDSLPKFMLENVEGKEYLNQLAIEFNDFLKKYNNE